MTPADITVVVPTLNEALCIDDCLTAISDAGATNIIVVDGGSQDDTVSIAESFQAACVLSSQPGRGHQLASGLAAANTDVVLFCHADNRLHPSCLRQICELDDVTWGAFRQSIGSSRSVFRWIEWGNAQRVRWRHCPFGDQGIFANRQRLNQLGGIATMPLMEDVELSVRLRKHSRPVLLPGPIHVDARRWESRGVVRQTLRNWRIQAGYRLGLSPERLATWYR
ncbi:MAG: TIGR04283 family arsenosugar biosynthesis glycosyltransferase [Planctomycetota bacterium]